MDKSRKIITSLFKTINLEMIIIHIVNYIISLFEI